MRINIVCPENVLHLEAEIHLRRLSLGQFRPLHPAADHSFLQLPIGDRRSQLQIFTERNPPQAAKAKRDSSTDRRPISLLFPFSSVYLWELRPNVNVPTRVRLREELPR